MAPGQAAGCSSSVGVHPAASEFRQLRTALHFVGTANSRTVLAATLSSTCTARLPATSAVQVIRGLVAAFAFACAVVGFSRATGHAVASKRCAQPVREPLPSAPSVHTFGCCRDVRRSVVGRGPGHPVLEVCELESAYVPCCVLVRYHDSARDAGARAVAVADCRVCARGVRKRQRNRQRRVGPAHVKSRCGFGIKGAGVLAGVGDLQHGYVPPIPQQQDDLVTLAGQVHGKVSVHAEELGPRGDSIAGQQRRIGQQERLGTRLGRRRPHHATVSCFGVLGRGDLIALQSLQPLSVCDVNMYR